MKISIGSDHGGYELKQQIISYLNSLNYEIEDFGTDSLSSVDYPDFGYKVAKSVSENFSDFGILVCTTGIGMSIVANKVKNIRCALVNNKEGALLTRQHNNANVLALGAKFTDIETAKEIISIFLETKFEAGRHQRRVDKIKDIENEVF